MTARWQGLVVIAIIASILSACQRDIPLLGEEDGPVDYDSVYLWAITLTAFDTLDPGGMPWDTSSSYLYDSVDYRFPDVFYNIGVSDSLFPFSYYQQSHFLNISPDTLPVAYQLVPATLIPYHYKPFFLRMYDFELDTPSVDSTFMDSILFVVGPDTVGPDKYPQYVSGIGANGASIILSLLWK